MVNLTFLKAEYEARKSNEKTSFVVNEAVYRREQQLYTEFIDYLETMEKHYESLENQVSIISDFIIDKVDGEPSRNEGVAETVIRLLSTDGRCGNVRIHC